MDHFEYIVDLVGIDHVTFGVDAIYGNHVDLHHVFQKQFSLDEVYSTDEEEEEEKEEEEEAPEVDHVKGMENLTEASHNILRWLVKNGYSDKEIKKVMSGNVLRALEEIW
jgi:membrane dipeptidase